MDKSKNQENCFFCKKKLNFWFTSLKKHKGNKVCSNCAMKIAKKEINESKQITETKVTCVSCGKIWHYGKEEQTENCGNSMHQLGKSMMCCAGCVPALFIPNKQIKDFDKCPDCNSKAIKKEKVIHNVE